MDKEKIAHDLALLYLQKYTDENKTFSPEELFQKYKEINNTFKGVVNNEPVPKVQLFDKKHLF